MSLTTVQIAELNSELINDPIAQGYVLEATGPSLSLLNDPALNNGGETIAKTLTVALLHDSIVVSDFAGNQVTDGERRYLESFMNREFSADIDAYKDKITATFRSNSTTTSNINSLVRDLSRAEVLFGKGAVIDKYDFRLARDL